MVRFAMKLSALLKLSISSAWVMGGALQAQVFITPVGNSANQFGYTGNVADPAGVSGYQTASVTGHSLISENVFPGGSVAYYLIAGRDSGPSPSTATAFGKGNGSVSGMANLSDALTNQAKTFFNLGLSSGPLVDFDLSWNLGSDTNALNPATGAVTGTLGVDSNWAGWTGSDIEERFYSADPSDVYYYLTLDDTPIVSFSYADIYMVIEYNNSGLADDVIWGYTGIMTPSIMGGLDGTQTAVANGFLSDVAANGGGVRVTMSNPTPAIIGSDVYAGKFLGNFAVDGFLQIVPVPEPSSLSLLAGLALGLGCLVRRRRR